MRFVVIKSVFQTNMLLSETCFFFWKPLNLSEKRNKDQMFCILANQNLPFKLLLINAWWHLLETRYLWVKLPRANFFCLFLLLLSLLLLLFAFISFWYYSLLFFETNIFVSNKAKGRISKRVFQENSTSNFRKNEHFIPRDTHTYVCVSQGKECSFFREFDVLCFLEAPVLWFVLLSYYWCLFIRIRRLSFIVWLIVFLSFF